jgi:hypothetical protein
MMFLILQYDYDIIIITVIIIIVIIILSTHFECYNVNLRCYFELIITTTIFTVTVSRIDICCYYCYTSTITIYLFLSYIIYYNLIYVQLDSNGVRHKQPKLAAHCVYIVLLYCIFSIINICKQKKIIFSTFLSF